MRTMLDDVTNLAKFTWRRCTKHHCRTCYMMGEWDDLNHHVHTYMVRTVKNCEPIR